jgi:hypothetical protein
VVWLPAGVILAFLLGWTGNSLWFLGLWTTLGAASGAIFALLLARFERRRSLHELSARRLAIWGATAGAAIPIVGSFLLVSLVTDVSLGSDAPIVFAALALLGASCAWATIAIARRGSTV